MTILDSQLVGHSFAGFSVELSRYAIGTITVFVVIWCLLKPFIQHTKIGNAIPKQTQFRRELLNSLRTVLVLVALDVVIFSLISNGDFKIYLDISEYGWLWFYSSIALAIVLHDTYFYRVHRAMYHPKLFKALHLTIIGPITQRHSPTTPFQSARQ